MNKPTEKINIEEDRIIFFLSADMKERFKKMCEEKTKRIYQREERKNHQVITMSKEIRRLITRELQRFENGSPF